MKHITDLSALPLLLGMSLLLGGLASSADAGELITPAFNRESPDVLRCIATNLGQHARAVTVEFINADGVVVFSTANPSLAPRAVFDVSDQAGGARYCRFDVEGSKNSWRALACIALEDRCHVTIPAE